MLEELDQTLSNYPRCGVFRCIRIGLMGKIRFDDGNNLLRIYWNMGSSDMIFWSHDKVRFLSWHDVALSLFMSSISVCIPRISCCKSRATSSVSLTNSFDAKNCSRKLCSCSPSVPPSEVTPGPPPSAICNDRTKGTVQQRDHALQGIYLPGPCRPRDRYDAPLSSWL